MAWTTAVDFQQSAKLQIVHSPLALVNTAQRRDRMNLCIGTLEQTLRAYCHLDEANKPKARLMIANGFHLDGREIDALIGALPGGGTSLK